LATAIGADLTTLVSIFLTGASGVTLTDAVAILA